jgi:hypothetical protein
MNLAEQALDKNFADNPNNTTTQPTTSQKPNDKPRAPRSVATRPHRVQGLNVSDRKIHNNQERFIHKKRGSSTFQALQGA